MNGFMKGGKDFVSPVGWADIYYKANQEFIASGVLVIKVPLLVMIGVLFMYPFVILPIYFSLDTPLRMLICLLHPRSRR